MLLFGRCKCYIKKNIRRIIAIAFGFFFIMMSTIGYLYFNAEYIQDKIKEKVCSCVLIHEDDLLKIVEECKSNEINNLSSHEIQENSYVSKIINKIFKTVRLANIYKPNDKIVSFTIKPTIVNTLWVGYRCGFYYTMDDKPFNLFEIGGNECDEETEGIVDGIGKYWYRTEQIDDNWWFYESKLEIYPAKH